MTSASPSSTTAPTSSSTGGCCCAVVELRQYTHHPHTRDTLIDLFERHFIEGQEAYGIQVLGQFYDEADPNRYVWLRGFDDMEARRVAIDEGFYHGPVWQAHRAAANATLIDADNVLLLKPVSAETMVEFDPARRPRLDVLRDGAAPGIFVATIYYFTDAVDPAFPSWFRTEVMPALAESGTTVLAQLVTETAPNTSKRLPVREGEHVFVWFARYADRAAADAAARQLDALPRWQERIRPALRSKLAPTRGTERLVLRPTRRSFLR